MTNKCGKSLQCTLSYITFLLSGCFIFSPLHKSDNIIISVISAFITGFILLKIILLFSEKECGGRMHSRAVTAVICIICCILSVFVNLMLITEIIKDTAYVANRGVSLYYYLSLALFILAVSYCLCIGCAKGIFRFSVLCSIFFILFILIMFLGFTTTKSAVFEFDFKDENAAISSIRTGVITGLFLVADSSSYIFSQGRFFKDDKSRLIKKPFYSGFIISFLLIAAYNILTATVFGTTLTKSISDPDYALIKLIPGIDITELVSAIRIVSFTVKSAIFVYTSSLCIKKLFSKRKKAFSLSVSLQYLLMPVIIAVLALFDNTLGYGAFQHLITPAVIIFSAMILILCRLLQKNN